MAEAQDNAFEFKNTFEGGMFKDGDAINRPKNTYTNCINCSLISQDGHDYVLKDCLGNVRTFSINIPYSGNYSTFAELPTVIAFISFPDTLVIYSTNSEQTYGGYGQIGKIDYIPYGEGIQPNAVTGQQNSGYIPLYHHIDLNFSKLHQIEGFAFLENDRIKRIYWSDNNEDPRVINIADPVFTTYIASGSLSLTAGTKYMVLEGAVSYNDGSGVVNYGPGMPNGNIITTGGASVNYISLTGTSPTPKVIEYIPYEILSWTPNRTLGNQQFAGYGSGNVICGSKIYFYRFGISGYKTPFSYPSAPVHITYPQQDNIKVSSSYHDTCGAGTTTITVNSGKSVYITITNIDTNFDTIELACVEYDQLWDTPRISSIVSTVAITGATMTLEHKTSGTEVTIDDLTLFPASINKIKSLTSSKNFILTANVEERPELSIDFMNPTHGLGIPTLTSFQYPMPSYGDPTTCANMASYTQIVPVAGANPAATTIVPNSRYVVTFGNNTTDTVTYRTVQYTTGQVITGVNSTATNNPTTIFFTGSGSVRPCVTKCRYTTLAGTVRRENYVEIPAGDAFWDNKSATVDQHCRAYWDDEKYRLAFVGIDLKGNPFYARYIGDITMPTSTSKGGLMIRNDFGGTNNFHSLNPSGIKISNLVIPQDIMDQLSGFMIVRAPRDPRILMQGLVLQCTTDASTPPFHRSIGWIQQSQDLNAATPLSNVYTYISPDNLIGTDILKGATGVTGDTMESAAWLDAVPFTGSVYVKAYGGQEQVISKLIIPLTGDTTKRTETITLWKEYNETEAEANYDGLGNTFQNTIYTGVAGTAPDIGCIGGGAYSLDSHNAQGGKKAIFKTNAGFLHYGPSANTYSAVAEAGNPKKVLMNYCKINTNQYGGTSATALARTNYISTGHFQPITASVKADTYNGGGYYIFNNIEIFGGDCFLNLIDYGYGLFDSALGLPNYSYAMSFPCASTVNYALRRGRKTSNVQLYYTGTALTESIVVNDGSSNTRLESYEYNKGYSSEGQTITYPALPENYIAARRNDTRVRFAGPKFAGETLDSFRVFLINDYKDMDGRGGAVNKIAVKDGRVLVWQVNITGTVPVLERQILSGLPGAVTNLGTGGVVDRFDPIKSDYGTQHQWSVVETDYGFVWFDMRKKAFMVFDNGVGDMSKATGNQSLFSEIFLETKGGTTVDATSILNSPTFAAESDMPIMGVGITGWFDPKFKTAYMCFKFKYQYLVSGNYNYINKDFTIAYNHERKQIVGTFSDLCPAIAHNHNQFVIMANNHKNKSKYYGINMPSTSYEIGDTVSYNKAEYICFAPVTIASYNGATAEEPGYSGTSAYWRKINQTNELWVMNQPATLGAATAPDYAYNTHFGKAITQDVEFIVNPPVGFGQKINVYAIEQGTNVKPTDIYIETDGQSASDTSIRATDTNYETMFNSVYSNLPLSSTVGMLIGDYLKIRIVKKNWTTDPTVVTGATRVLKFVKSFFSLKK